jgi:hypothetical protein
MVQRFNQNLEAAQIVETSASRLRISRRAASALLRNASTIAAKNATEWRGCGEVTSCHRLRQRHPAPRLPPAASGSLVGYKPPGDEPRRALIANVWPDGWLEEFRLYHRDANGLLVKQGDDAISASRYAMMMLRYGRTNVPSKPRRIRLGRAGWMAA